MTTMDIQSRASEETMEPVATPGSAATLAIAASATLLVLAVFSAAVTTVGDSVRGLHAGVAGETWVLSGMSLGMATALLAAPGASPEGRFIVAYGTPLDCGKPGSVTPAGRPLKKT